MRILGHRGYWKDPSEKNREIAFARAFDLGFGVETDVRDLAGTLVISHDPPYGAELTLDAFLEVLGPRDVPLAINVKSDGLAGALRDIMRRHAVIDWFAFDMSVPDMRGQIAAGNPVFARVSELEPWQPWMASTRGVWLDAFDSEWYGTGTLAALLAEVGRVCIVSPELHGRPHRPLWDALRPLRGDPRILLCTDHPEQAADFLGNDHD